MLSIAFFSLKISEYSFKDDFKSLTIPVCILTFAGVLFYYPLAYWSLMGMETGLLTLLLSATLYLSFLFMLKGNHKRLWVISILTGLMFLTRNESIIFATLIWVFICWKIYKKIFSKEILHSLILSLGIIFLFVAGQLSFQYFYYGEFLPNTYNLKLTGLPFKARISDGMSFIKPFIFNNWFPLLLILVDLALNFKKIKLYLLSFFLVSLMYQIYIGADAKKRTK